LVAANRERRDVNLGIDAAVSCKVSRKVIEKTALGCGCIAGVVRAD
jgi:hypothetical protein